ncbi:MAG: HAD family hydrolase [Bilifractor sp.]
MRIQDFEGAIFDLDGTLLDSMGVWHQIDVDFLAKRGIEVPDDYQKAITPLGALEAARYTIRRFHLENDTPEGLVREWLDMAQEAYSSHLPLKPYALNFVKYLKEAGLHIAVATSSDDALVRPCLERTGLMRLLDDYCTGNDVKRGKGFPDIYLKAAAAIGTDPGKTMVFEDIAEGLKGANAGGFYTVGVYEKANYRMHPEMMEIADEFIFSFRELLPDDRMAD